MEGTRLGRYRLERRLAAGGMAEVFAATVEGAAGFQKAVAIKRILPHLCEDPDFVEMFREEARLASRLSHANIAQVFDFDEIDGQYLLAMEWVNGKDLRKVLRAAEKAGHRPSPARAAFIAREVAKALHHAHAAPAADGRPLCLVHRDVSPQNVLLSFAGEVKLTDFGIAKAATRSIATGTGIIKGKCAYMSPEQARGESLDARSDIFALGIVLWEALTGRRLFTGESDIEILRAVQDRSVPPPIKVRSDVPRDLDAVVMRALAKNRDDRQNNALELETALTDIILRHATGADDLDISAWLRELFQTEKKEEIETRGDIRKRLGGRDKNAYRPSSPTPPEPHEAGEPPLAAQLPKEASTKGLSASTSRGKGALRGALTIAAAIGAIAATSFALLLWPPSPTEPLDEPAAHDGGQRPEQHSASRVPTSASPSGAKDEMDSTPLTSPSGAPEENLDGEEKQSLFFPLEAPKDDASSSTLAKPSAPKPSRRAAKTRSTPPHAVQSLRQDHDERTSLQRPVGIATVLSPPQQSRPQGEEPPRLLPAGTRLEARLVLGVKTDGHAPVEARLVRSGVAGDNVLLPRGTRLIGRATSSGERVAIEFHQTILPSERALQISAIAFGGDGRPGLPALDILTSGEATGNESGALTLAPGTDLTAVLTADLVLP